MSENKAIQSQDDVFPDPFYTLENGKIQAGKLAVIILGDHTGTKGLDHIKFHETGMDSGEHYVYDIGSEDVVKALTDYIGGAGVYTWSICNNYSRLLIETNRSEAQCITTHAEGVPIPSNVDITDEEKQRRIDAIYKPYDAAVQAQIKKVLDAGGIPVVVALHSFTKRFANLDRPEEIGVMNFGDKRMSKAMWLVSHSLGYRVEMDKPYDGRFVVDAALRRATEELLLPNVFLEVRNDLIDTPEKADLIAAFLSGRIIDAARDPSVHAPISSVTPTYTEFSADYFGRYFEAACRGERLEYGCCKCDPGPLLLPEKK